MSPNMTDHMDATITGPGTVWWRNGDHPQDRIGEPLTDPIHGTAYLRQEGAVVRYFCHPDIPHTRHCDRCGNIYHLHGWIDSGGEGITVCPGDRVFLTIDGRALVTRQTR